MANKKINMKKLFCLLGFHKWYKSTTVFGNPDHITTDTPRIVSRVCTRKGCRKNQTLKYKWIDTNKLNQ